MPAKVECAAADDSWKVPTALVDDAKVQMAIRSAMAPLWCVRAGAGGADVSPAHQPYNLKQTSSQFSRLRHDDCAVSATNAVLACLALLRRRMRTN